MHELVQEASRALLVQDADTLEGLVVKASASEPPCDSTAELKRACLVLSAQVDAAAAHLALRSRVLTATEGYKATSWER
jgi:hypothetical protein